MAQRENPAAQFFPSETLSAISACFANCCAATVCRWLFTAITAASWFAMTTADHATNSSPETPAHAVRPRPETTVRIPDDADQRSG